MDTWGVLQILTISASMLLVLLFLYKQSGSHGIKLAFSFFGAFALSAAAYYLGFPSGTFSQIAVSALMYVYALTCFDGKLYMRLIIGAIPPLLLFACDKTADALMLFITPSNVMPAASLSAASYGRIILYNALCLLTFIPLSAMRSKDNRHIPIFQRMLLTLLLAAGIAVMAMLIMAIVTMSSRYSENPTEDAIRMCIFAAATVLFMYVGVMFLFYNTADMYKKNYEISMKAQRAELEAAHDKNIQETYETMRTWRHDMKNHIRTMRSLAEQGQLPELLAYIDESYDMMDRSMSYISTGHPAFDATLSNKLYAAKNMGITVKTLISVPENLPLSSVDLCSVLSNLLDNAITAAAVTEKPSLYVEITVKGCMLCIKVENSSNGEYKTQDGIFLSTKKSPDEHGLGLKSVQRITESLCGSVKIQPEADKFTVTVILPLERGECE